MIVLASLHQILAGLFGAFLFLLITLCAFYHVICTPVHGFDEDEDDRQY